MSPEDLSGTIIASQSLSNKLIPLICTLQETIVER
jgi:hypothetical protein